MSMTISTLEKDDQNTFEDTNTLFVVNMQCRQLYTELCSKGQILLRLFHLTFSKYVPHGHFHSNLYKSGMWLRNWKTNKG